MPPTTPPPEDPRRGIPRTDDLLADPRLRDASARLSAATVRAAVRGAQERARAGVLPPGDVLAAAVAALPPSSGSLRPVLNATGVVVHTNLGRAPLSTAAREAVARAAGYTDVEFDRRTGRRGPRGAAVVAALREHAPDAEDALVVNNGAAALLLAVTALAAGREVVVSRGELVQIGDGFRLPDLMASTGAVLREVGTTNRTTPEDYAAALGPRTGCIVKVHPGNFRIEGFTAAAGVAQLAHVARQAGSPAVPVVVDTGSGLLAPDPTLPHEPDATTALRDGADLVTASGDKLLGGPQAGLVLGRTAVVQQLRRHPLARALRVDKLALAALEATVRGPAPPVTASRGADPERLRQRAQVLADRTGGVVVPHEGTVGGGGAPGVALPGWAVALPEQLAAPLREGEPAVVGHVERGRLLLDLRCVPEDEDGLLADLVRAADRAAGV